MRGLLKLYFLITYTFVSRAPFVLAQDKTIVIHDCKEDGATTELRPGLSTGATIIRSFNFTSGHYRNSEDCQIQFWADSQPLVLSLTFNFFDVEAEPKCRKDYLCINGVHFCGGWEVNKTFTFNIPAHKSFTLRFVTDATVSRRGFEITAVGKITNKHAQFPEVSGGYGSAEEHLVRTEPRNSIYRDRCYKRDDHLRPRNSFASSKSYTATTDGPDTTYNDYQSKYASDKTTHYPHLTDYNSYDPTSNPLLTNNRFSEPTPKSFRTDNHNYDNTSNPYNTDNPNYDTAPNILQMNNTNYDTTPNPLQKDNPIYDTSPTSDQSGQSNNDTAHIPLQTNNLNYDTTYNPLQKDNSSFDTSDNPLQKDNPGHKITPNAVQKDNTIDNNILTPLQTDNKIDEITHNPLQKDHPNNTTPKYLQSENPNYDITPNTFKHNNIINNTTPTPLQADNISNNTMQNPLQNDNNIYDTTPPSLHADNPSNNSTTNPLHKDNIHYDTIFKALRKDNPNNKTIPSAHQKDNLNDNTYHSLETYYPSHDPVPPTLQTYHYGYETTQNSHTTDNPEYDNTRNQPTSDYTLVDRIHDLLHIHHPEKDTTQNSLETTQFNYITSDPHETHYPRTDFTSDPQRSNYITDNVMDPVHANYHHTASDMRNGVLSTPVPLKTQTPVIICNSHIQPVSDNSPSATYIFRNAGFGSRPYYNNQQCSVEFRTSSTARLFTVKFTSLDLESHPFCDYDSICVGGVRFCGSSEMAHAFSYVVPAHQTFTLAFISDISNTGAGFEVEVDIQDAIGSSGRHGASTNYRPPFDSTSHRLRSTDNYVDTCSFAPVHEYVVTSKQETTVDNYQGTTVDNYQGTTVDNYQDITVNHDQSTSHIPVTTQGQYRTTNSDQITNYNVQTEQSDYQTMGKAYQTTDKVYQTTGKDYQITDKSYQTTGKDYQITDKSYQTTETTDKAYLTIDKSYQTLDNGYVTTDNAYQTADSRYLKTDSKYQTTDSRYQTTNPRYETTDPGIQRTDNSVPDSWTTDDIDGGKDNFSVPSRNPWVRNSTIYCGDHPSTVKVSNEDSWYIVKSGRQGDGTRYANNERCLVVYGTPNVSKMFTVMFKTFEIEYQKDCCYDSLCVKSVNYCGDWAEGRSFSHVVPANSTFTLAFSTDESKTGRGFEVHIAISDPLVDEEVLEVYTGVGSRAESLTYKVSNIHDYTDKCQQPVACSGDRISPSVTVMSPHMTTHEPSTNWQAPFTDSSFLAQHLHVILRMIEAAQERISYAYDLLASLV